MPWQPRYVRIGLASGMREDHREDTGHAVSTCLRDEQQHIPECPGAARLERVRVHEPHLTCGQRLREAGVSEGGRALLLGHAITRLARYDATATIWRLAEVAKKLVQGTRNRITPQRVASD